MSRGPSYTVEQYGSTYGYNFATGESVYTPPRTAKQAHHDALTESLREAGELPLPTLSDYIKEMTHGPA